MQHHF